MALIPIMSALLQTVSQMLLQILSKRQIVTLLSATALGLVLPLTLGAHNNRFLLITQYSFMIAASAFRKTVVFSILVLLFNEEWRARILGIFITLRGSLVICGLCAITATYGLDDELFMPSLMGCTVLSYVSFFVASYSLPPEKVDKSVSDLPFYSTLDSQMTKA